MPPHWHFPRIALASQSFVVSSKFRGFFFSIFLKKWHWNFDRGLTEPLDVFG